MGNVRVYELSKELDKSNKEILNVAMGLGISVKSHASSISTEEARKITDKINSTGNNKSSNQEKKTEEKEKVRVFKSDSGAEVVERRKGSRVVLRRKKKTIEPQEESVTQQPDDQAASEQVSEIQVRSSEEESETATSTPDPQTAEAGDQAAYESVAEEGLTESDTDAPEAIDDEATIEAEQADAADARVTKGKSPEQDDTEDKSKKFKKSKKGKIKKEEIIDEDTLEELRKAFSTKLPGRRREYLVEDKRPRNRPGGGGLKRDRSFDRRSTQMRGRSGDISDTETNEAAVFPAKPGKKSIKIGETINVGELAKLMGVKSGELIKKLLMMGVKATINEVLDHETAVLIAEEFDCEVTVDIFEEDELLLEDNSDTTSENLTARPPVVTVMGHVDHGKTTLLDAIRETNVVSGEAGGITQHIGAYSVEVDGRTMSFIDTPGHEAFTAMRARGAKVTDVVILVVAADDGVMPQTIEAVNHAKSADVPIIVAVNKIDKADADKDKILRQLSEIGLVSEEWGGDTLFADVSAKQKKGIKELLELVLLQADILELRADAEKRANGFVVEAVLDKGRGPVATLLVSEGTLSVGNFVVAGTTYGKVRALMDDKGNRVDSAGPGMPVEIMGLSYVPQAGERFYVVTDEKAAKEVVSHRETKERERAAAKNVKLKPTLENLFETLEEEETKELALIIKADTQGSVEAIQESVDKLGTDKCQVKIIHTGVGGISETDVNLASASNAIIVGFNVRPDAKALEVAELEGVSFELHTIIYNVIDRVKNAMEGLLDPIVKEKITGHAEVKETFSISRIGTIAGCMVNDGKVTRDSSLRVLRDGVIVFDGKIESLKRFKDDAKEVVAGFECGIGIERFNDVKVGDTFEFYSFEEHKQEL